jgi:hypothetical protein
MNRCHEDDYEDEDAGLNESISEDDPDGMSLESDELRSARIEEYRYAALQHEDPLRANLGAVTAGLLDIVSKTETVVRNAMSSAGVNCFESPNAARAINTHLNLTREVNRYANLELRLAEGERQAEARTRRHMDAQPTAVRRRGRM